MAFCKQCGTYLDGARFCANCGTAADGGVAVQQGHSVASAAGNEREHSLAEMERMIRYFGAKDEQYNEYDKVTEEIKQRRAHKYYGWLFFGMTGILVGLFLLSNAGYSGNIFLAILMGVVICLVPPAGILVLFVVLRKKNKKKLNAALAKQAELGAELADYYAAYGYCPVGIEYTDRSSLYKLYEMTRTGRANTPGDAINRWRDDLHKAEVQKTLEATLAASKEAAEAAKRAEFNSLWYNRN